MKMAFCSLIVAMLIVQGCAAPSRQIAVPADLELNAQIPGFKAIRYRLGIDQTALARESLASVKREQSYLSKRGQKDPLPIAYFLAISGGGEKGAFGAGLLNGWTTAGNRPQFKLVTGISTGALIAPFAFLGPKYDATLKAFYTTTSTSDILDKRNLFAAINNDALADSRPLQNQLEKQVTQNLLDAIAAEYAKGRLLFIGTVDIDAENAVIWNMTRIASVNDPKALDLFRSIMLASASIPGVFPPVMIDVQAGGTRYQEMHVDGGTMGQVFVYPAALALEELALEEGIDRERRLYIIRNGQMKQDWATVERRTWAIGIRALSTLMRVQGLNDLYRIYMIAQRDDVDYNLAIISHDFNAPKKEAFDPEYMSKLFDLGYSMAAKGYPWSKIPPYYDPPDDAEPVNP